MTNESTQSSAALPEFRSQVPGLLHRDALLHHLPVDMDRELSVTLDAVTFSSEMVGVAYHRLERGLAQLSRTNDPETERLAFAAVFADAWLIIDASVRLSRMASKVPGIEDLDSYQAFSLEADSARQLRNRFQHLDEDVGAIAGDGRPLYGSLFWVHIDPSLSPPRRSRHLIEAATARRGHVALPMDEVRYDAQTDCIRLIAHGTQASITYLLVTIAKLMIDLEAWCRCTVSGHPEVRPANIHVIAEYSDEV